MAKSRIYLSPPHLSGEELEYITEAFETNWVAPLGPNVDAFEREIAETAGIKNAVAVSSGTAAIHLALSLLGVARGDVVFCSSLTFVASANPILYQGATPVFIDSEPETWNMSPKALKKALQKYYQYGILPKAVIVVNLYGQSAKMEELAALCNQYGVPIIEDAAESLGTLYKGRQSGTFGKFGIYSFNGNKIITTSGGGMLVSDDLQILEKAKFLASQARDQAPYYQHSEMGYNYRMSNLLAGVGRSQLQKLSERVAARRRVFNNYYEALGSLPGFSFMPELEGTKMNRWLTALTVDEHAAGVSVKQLLDKLGEENIEARHVWKPLHLQPLFDGANYFSHEKNRHVAEELFYTGICLPSGSSLSEEEQDRVIECITKAVKTSLGYGNYQI